VGELGEAAEFGRRDPEPDEEDDEAAGGTDSDAWGMK